MKKKTLLIIFISLVILIILACLGFILYYTVYKPHTDRQGQTELTQEKETAEPEIFEESMLEEEDKEETVLADSDNDGLSDEEELKYNTDPNNKDTDNDGYTDYEEIQSGYNPLQRPQEEEKEDSLEISGDSAVVPTSPDPIASKHVFFVHHSTGEIYWNGGLEDSLSDHNYIGYAPWWDGPTDPQDFYNEFTDPDKWNIIANENMPEGRERDIIIFKSCFPSSNIESDSMFEDYKKWYRQLFEIYAAHPDKLFVPMSTPPLLETNTTHDAAQRANSFEYWLTVDYVAEYEEYLENQGKNITKNLAPFQLHSILSDSNGYLAEQFQSDPYDDHPNHYSGEVVGDAMWQHLNKALVNAGLNN